MRLPLTIVLLLSVSAMSACREEGDETPIDQAAAERGAVLARDCTGCHVLEREQNKIGPHLVGVMGRQVGSVAGYDYSRGLAEEDRVWDVELLENYIATPTTIYPGTKMAESDLSISEVEDVVAYLRSLKD